MPWTESNIPALAGRDVLITGANSGLGLAAAKMFAKHGARVLMACRNATKAEAAAAKVRETATGPVEIISLDLASLASVDACAAGVRKNEKKLDLLINNAGLMAVDHSVTEEGFETQLGVNHLGHFALTAKLMPLLSSTDGARVVSMSSFGHRLGGRINTDDLFFQERGYNRWTPYFHSKLANLLFTLELARRLDAAKSQVRALAAHPGGTRTDLGSEGHGASNFVTKIGMNLAQPASIGALPLMRAAVDPSSKNGEFYGPNIMIVGYPRREKPSRHARNETDQRVLWEKSEALTGVKFEV